MSPVGKETKQIFQSPWKQEIAAVIGLQPPLPFQPPSLPLTVSDQRLSVLLNRIVALNAPMHAENEFVR